MDQTKVKIIKLIEKHLSSQGYESYHRDNTSIHIATAQGLKLAYVSSTDGTLVNISAYNKRGRVELNPADPDFYDKLVYEIRTAAKTIRKATNGEFITVLDSKSNRIAVKRQTRTKQLKCDHIWCTVADRGHGQWQFGCFLCGKLSR